MGATDASLTVMIGICRSPKEEHFVWRPPVGNSTAKRLLRDDNPIGYLTINNLELVVYVAHLHLFVPLMALLYHTATKVENTASESWASIVSVSSATAVGPLLRAAAWIIRQKKHMRY